MSASTDGCVLDLAFSIRESRGMPLVASGEMETPIAEPTVDVQMARSSYRRSRPSARWRKSGAGASYSVLGERRTGGHGEAGESGGDGDACHPYGRPVE